MRSFIACLYIGVLLAGCTCVSNIPTSTKMRRNLFNHYLSLLLPDGRETTIYLLKDITKRYYFSLAENTAPHFSITVTPCDVPIEWSILQYTASHAVNGKMSDEFPFFGDLKSQSTSKTVSTLFHYQGNSVENFIGAASHSSIFVLEFLSNERDTHISVYLTTDLKHGNLFPELPADPRVDVTSLGHNSAMLVWKPSPSALRKKENIEYCLLVNEKHNYKSLCAADTAIRSVRGKQAKVSSIPISQDLEDNHSVMILSNSELSVIHKMSNLDIRQICIGNRNVYTVHNLSSNTQYYFDVFVVNLLTNASAAYTGTFAKTLEPRPKISYLKDGKIVHISLDGKKEKVHNYQYQATHKKVQFTFQLCRGQVRVQISRNGKTLVSETIQALRHITLKGKPNEKYTITLKSIEHASNSSIMVQASSHIYRPLFPFFPDSLKIKSFNKLRTCDSITIAWLGTQERNMYCVYKKRIQEEQIWRELSKVDRCSGPESRPKSEKVSCKYFHNINVQKAVTSETIGGLQKGSSYLLDVYLMGTYGTLVRYHSKVVKTRKMC
uniref:Protein NDNF n=1 Tax=Leptobrachium leishanense TaxID=445787 RepID=A0A8C5PU89_9ANUR